MRSRWIALLTLPLWIGCYDVPSGTGGPTEDPECQLQSEGERNPGYPFDLTLYANDVLPVLTSSCAASGCHAAPVGSGNFTVWADAAPGNCDYARTFNSIAGAVDLALPTNSRIYTAISGADPTHPIQYQEGAPQLETILAYVTDASERYLADGGGGGTAPPGASPFDYDVFQSEIQPILDGAEGRGCALSGCHGTGAGAFTLVEQPAPGSADMEENFLAVTRRTNLEDPPRSLFYVQSLNRHAAGTSTVVNGPQGAAILAWIEDAKENAGDAGDGAVNCAPVDRFNVGVFRDEIMPILSGALDLNNPGGGSAGRTGCTAGPCHGTQRGPGSLTLSDTADPVENLQNFACFVNLQTPSGSEILACPLNDPRCRRYPHPGQDVFSGADDRNYQRLLAYLYGSRLDATPLDFAFFVRRINPIFNDLNAVEGGAQGRTCADTVACHGISVVGQQAANGSNFPILANAADVGRLTYNFVSAAGFVNFLQADQSSLFLYPTNEIANLANPLATGLPHPGGADFAPDSDEALAILAWAGGLRPDAQGFQRNWLVAGDYPAAQVSDSTLINEAVVAPRIFDSSGAQFNAGQWDGLFSNRSDVNLNEAFPRGQTTGRVAYAVAYIINTSPLPLQSQLIVQSPNALRVYVNGGLVAQDDVGGGVTAVATLPAFSQDRQVTRVMLKVFQRSTDQDFRFSVQLRDEFGNVLTDSTGELIITLGPDGGI